MNTVCVNNSLNTIGSLVSTLWNRLRRLRRLHRLTFHRLHRPARLALHYVHRLARERPRAQQILRLQILLVDHGQTPHLSDETDAVLEVVWQRVRM